MREKTLSKLKRFAKRYGMQIAVALALLALAGVSVGAMGGTMQQLRRELTETPDTPAPVQPKQQPEPAPTPQQPDDPQRPQIPNEDEEPLTLPDDPVAGDTGLAAEINEQQVIAAETLLPVYTRPVQGEIVREFSGDTLVKSATMGDWRTHNGADIAAAPGETALAMQSGKVEYMMQEDLWGFVVELRLDSGILLRYCALEAPAPGLQVGTRLAQGDPVGTVGTALLESAQEPHLHLEAVRAGKYIDPRELLG